ncbi:MAG TPA: hypothetical protein VH054_15875 [Polyangiaceae bacterium]|jgi:hypothetical protein|nr:hypothetical protein [Polyangiaceae bacterium]
MRRVFLAFALAACDSGSATFDAGPSDAQSSVDVCTAFCQASGVVTIVFACGKVADASAYGACAPDDAAALTCYVDAGPPFLCVALATTTGTCGVSMTFEDAGTFDAETTITLTPPGCCGGILVATPSSLDLSPPCDDAGAD